MRGDENCSPIYRLGRGRGQHTGLVNTMVSVRIPSVAAMNSRNNRNENIIVILFKSWIVG